MYSKRAPRRRHSAQLKAKVLAACNEPGASIAAVALSHGLNANLVRKWRVGRGLKLAGIAAPVAVPVASLATQATQVLVPDARFLPIEMSPPNDATRAGVVGQVDAAHRNESAVHIELRRGPSSLTVRWPAAAAGDCAAWLGEVAAGLLK